ncbi:MAG: hypothetical protein Ta2B_23180 [Termitinemataceae bacterium]|nr:MAG: hypothetical protein Ta2B_23180 [Termitinemataceae bacterium]
MSKIFGGCVVSTLFFLTIPVFPIEAADVSVIVIETGLSQDNASSLAGIWESGIMDVLFEAGHIVTNAQSIKIIVYPVDAVPQEVRTSISEALEGGAQYFIIAVLNYNQNIEGKELQPIQVTLEVINLSNNKSLYKQVMSKPAAINPRDEFSYAQKAARIIMPYIGGSV